MEGSPSIDPAGAGPILARSSCLHNAVPTGAMAAVMVTGLYLALHAVGLVVAPLMTSFSGDEYTNYYQAARNFNQFGFLNSTFLQDFSTSSDPHEHPYVYDHMGSGPEIAVALVTRVGGENYRAVRFFFAGVFCLGLYFYFRFATLLFGNLGFCGAGYAFLLLDPNIIMALIEHPGHASFPFFAFFPLVALQRWHATKKPIYLVAGLAAVMISTYFLVVQLVILNVASCFLLAALRIFPITRRDFLAILAATATGFGLHVVQNVVHLGPTVAIQELTYTISNRVTGYPPGPDLVAFYQSIDVVHHGVHTLRPKQLSLTLLYCFSIRLIKGMLIVGAVFLVYKTIAVLSRRRMNSGEAQPIAASGAASLTNLSKLACWAVPAIVMPVLVFPAYSVDYNLQGNGHFLSALLGIAFLNVVYQSMLASPFITRSRFLVATLLVLAVLPFFARQGKSWGEAYRDISVNRFGFLDQIESHLQHKVTMTNMYPVAVGFFTREKVFGAAEMDCFPEQGDPDPYAAYSKFIAHLEKSGMDRPTHYVHSRIFLPGYGKSLDPDYNQKLKDHIAQRHRMIYEDEYLTIFELAW